ncbi:MAG: radical SAM protein, partial [Nitrospina sp.]|nr:radical SAM protein [Nitrospina sp.]
RGDGEDVLLNLVKNLDEGQPVEEQSGLYRKINGKILEPACDLAMVEDMTKIPHPDRLLLPYKRYNSVLNPREFETTMITSRGCPHKCNFCKMDVQKVYCRTTEQVVEEFKSIADLGITDIQIYDDTFTWSKKRVLEICEGILDNNIKVNWAIRDRVKRADEDIYKLMKRAGCYRIHFGVETGSKRILDATGKATTLEEAEHAIGLAKAEGFDTMAYYMFGFPDETRQDMDKTVSFAKKLDTRYAAFAVTIPYAGTALYDLGLDKNIVPYDFWKEFTKIPTPNFRIPHLIEEHLNREDLIDMKNNALFTYYFRPKMIWRELRELSSWREFKRKSEMAMNIFSDSMKKKKAGAQYNSKNIDMYHNLTS